MWKKYRAIIGKKVSDVTPILIVNGQTITNKEEIAEKIAQEFETASSTLILDHEFQQYRNI